MHIYLTIKEKYELKKNDLIIFKKVYKKMTGTVYLLSTDIDGYFKCGYIKDLTSRINNLQTGCVKDIQLLYHFQTRKPKILEKIIHEMFKNYRPNNNREHFTCNVTDMSNAINTGLY
jgi:virulence-associated protein VapD